LFRKDYLKTQYSCNSDSVSQVTLQNRITANLRNVDVLKYSNQQESELDDNQQGVNKGRSKRSLSPGSQAGVEVKYRETFKI
jgi:hypothetical protein